MKDFFKNLKSNRLTGWQVAVLTAVIMVAVFVGLYLADPQIISK